MFFQQVNYSEKKIKEDLNLFPHSNVVIVQYENLSINLEDTIDELAKLIRAERKLETALPNIRINKTQSVKDSIFEQIVNEFKSIRQE